MNVAMAIVGPVRLAQVRHLIYRRFRQICFRADFHSGSARDYCDDACLHSACCHSMADLGLMSLTVL